VREKILYVISVPFINYAPKSAVLLRAFTIMVPLRGWQVVRIPTRQTALAALIPNAAISVGLTHIYI
jgi:hypothetical protein